METNPRPSSGATTAHLTAVPNSPASPGDAPAVALVGTDPVATDGIPSALLRHALLSSAEETELAKRCETAVFASQLLAQPDRSLAVSRSELQELVSLGAQAREALVAANLRLVATIAREASRRSGVPVSELFQEGVLGLLEAVQRFDHTRGVRFGSWASVQIRSRVLLTVATRAGELTVSIGVQVRKLHNALQQRPGTDQELAATLGWSVGKVARLRRRLVNVPIDQVGDVTDSETEDAYREAIDRRASAQLLDALPAQQRAVIRLRFGFDGPACSRGEVGCRLGIAEHVVRRLETLALSHLRVLMQAA